MVYYYYFFFNEIVFIFTRHKWMSKGGSGILDHENIKKRQLHSGIKQFHG